MQSNTIRSVGPGAADNVLDMVRTLPQLEAAADPNTFQPPAKPHGIMSPYDPLSDEVQRMVKSVLDWQPPMESLDGTVSFPEDPTWGFTVMVTVYEKSSLDRLPRALENWIAITDRQLRFHSHTLPTWAAEAQQRLRVEVYQDPALDDAPEDGVRAAFRDLLRGRGLLHQGDMPPPPGRNMACIILNADTITALANLTVPKDARSLDHYFEWESIKVPVLDAYWSTNSEGEDGEEVDNDEGGDEDGGSYLGTGRLSVNAMASFYNRLTTAAHGGAMRELHPLDGFPP